MGAFCFLLLPCHFLVGFGMMLSHPGRLFIVPEIYQKAAGRITAEYGGILLRE
jgi:hypothetical protein